MAVQQPGGRGRGGVKRKWRDEKETKDKSKIPGGKKKRSFTVKKEENSVKSRNAEARAKAKWRREKRRPSSEPLISSLVHLYEKLRSPSLDKDRKARQQQVALIIAKLGTNDENSQSWLSVCKSHRSSRVVQAIFKHGDDSQKQVARRKLQPFFADLANEQYGHFVVVRALDHTRGENRNAIIEVLVKQAKTLTKSAHGSVVLSSVYSFANNAQRQAMIAQFFFNSSSSVNVGNQYIQTSKNTYTSVHEILIAEPHRRAEMLACATQAVRPALEKSLLDAPLIHRVLLSLLESGSYGILDDMRDNLCGPPLLRMIHTKEGARVACIMISVATAKERKAIVKAMKPQIRTIIRDEYGHLVLISLLQNVDDTVLLKKSILTELLKDDLKEILLHKSARVPIMALIAPSVDKYITPAKRAILSLPDALLNAKYKSQTGNKNTDCEDDSDKEIENTNVIDEILPTSKKDPLQRRLELLGNGTCSLGDEIMKVCETHIDQLMICSHGGEVLKEVARGGENSVIIKAVGEDRIRTIHSAMIEFIVSEQTRKEIGSPLEEYFCSRMLKRLLLLNSGDVNESKLVQEFASSLWKKAIKGRINQLVNTHAAKVVAALLFCGHELTVSELKKELAKVIKTSVDDWASGVGFKYNIEK